MTPKSATTPTTIRCVTCGGLHWNAHVADGRIDQLERELAASQLQEITTVGQLQTSLEDLARVTAERDAKQASIDELMLEYCPEEMTTEQLNEYARNQAALSAKEKP